MSGDETLIDFFDKTALDTLTNEVSLSNKGRL